MLLKRVMPCLLLINDALIKTIKFKNPNYIGDPINTVRIFNQKEVDELIFLDISATKNNHNPPFHIISNISQECFMPFSYGGGIKTMEHVDKLFSIGVEKISINNIIFNNPDFITKVAKKYGNQSIIASIDVKKDIWGNYKVYSYVKQQILKLKPTEYAKYLENLGAGEILLTSVDNDGVMKGYDIKLVKEIVDFVSIPVIACGGAGTIKDIDDVLNIGDASGAAVGSMVVYQSKNRAVLINYPDRSELDNITRSV